MLWSVSMDLIENLDEEFAFREQMNEAIAASAHQTTDEFVMALRFQEMLENELCLANNEWKDAEDGEFLDEPAIDPHRVVNRAHGAEEWSDVVEEFRKLSMMIRSLNFNGDDDKLECAIGPDEDEWDDAVEDFGRAQRESGEEEEFGEAVSCGNEFGEKAEGFFSLYFKGLSAIGQGPSSNSSGLGVVLRKPDGGILVQFRKKLDFYVVGALAEHLGLIDGLLAALERGVTRVNAFTDSEAVYDQVARGRGLDNQLLIAVRERVLEHVRKLDDFVLTVVGSDDMRIALWLAREAIFAASCGNALVPWSEECERRLPDDYAEPENDGVLWQGSSQSRKRRYGHKGVQRHFRVTTWGEASEALEIDSWREREKGIGEWKFS